MKIFLTKTTVEKVTEPYDKHKNTDYRRKLLAVHFSNGATWYPRLEEIQHLNLMLNAIFTWNIQYGDLDKK